MIYVIGSGPASVSAAQALLLKGHKVKMLDVGYELESNRQELASKLRLTPFENWLSEDLDPLRENMAPDVKGLPQKLTFGSDYPFRAPSEFVQLEQTNSDILASHARGGLSNVWGANLLPFIQADIDDWPISLRELAPYYKAVLNFVSFSGPRDDLTAIFPAVPAYQPLRQSNQAQALIADLAKHRSRLSEKGIHFGQSRLAIRTTPQNGDQGCIYCGMCMYGCPFDLIYSSRTTLNMLRANQNFEYLPGYYVKRLEESGSEVKVHTLTLKSNTPQIFSASKVFLGAGTVSSARIMLESLDAFDREIRIKDSQYFLVPLLRLQRSKGATAERLQTLSQVAIELLANSHTNRSLHLLIYTYNDLYTRALKKMLGISYKLFAPFASQILERLLVLQGYLHSDDSAQISLRIEKGSTDHLTKIILQGLPNARTKPIVNAALKQIISQFSAFKALPLLPLKHIGLPGKSYHAGATFPMSAEPTGMQSDRLGRPVGFKNLHLIDASCFTSVPATNVTFSVMANAYRIASEAS